MGKEYCGAIAGVVALVFRVGMRFAFRGSGCSSPLSSTSAGREFRGRGVNLSRISRRDGRWTERGRLMRSAV
jgi:hypothetical protein